MIMQSELDIKRELYDLGEQAESLIGRLAEAQDKATMCRLKGWSLFAGQFSTLAALLAAELEQVGKRQNAIIAQIEASGENFYL